MTAASRVADRRIANLARLIVHGPHRRPGIAELAAAADGLAALARSIATVPTPEVAVITGFFMEHGDPPACETDGPVGAAHLCAGLTAAGFGARVATDAPNAGAVRAALTAAGLPDDFPMDVVVVPSFAGGDDLAAVIGRWRANPPSHVVAIERCGPAEDGAHRRADGTDISAYTAPLDRLFTAGDWVTAAIGDGGNELGMGTLPRDLLHAHVPLGQQIACTVPCDHLVVAGVSNWGAQALLCAVAAHLPGHAAALTANLTAAAGHRILHATVHHGPAVAAVDWPPTEPPRQALSVDGLDWPHHAEMLAALVACLSDEPQP